MDYDLCGSISEDRCPVRSSVDNRILLQLDDEVNFVQTESVEIRYVYTKDNRTRWTHRPCGIDTPFQLLDEGSQGPSGQVFRRCPTMAITSEVVGQTSRWCDQHEQQFRYDKCSSPQDLARASSCISG